MMGEQMGGVHPTVCTNDNGHVCDPQDPKGDQHAIVRRLREL